MIIWDCNESIAASAILGCSFASQLLAIQVIASNQRSTWFSAGFLTPVVTIDNLQFIGQSIKLTFGNQLITLPYENYQLKYYPPDWVDVATIKIKQLESRDYLNMGINYQPVDKQTGPIVAGTVAGAVTSFTIAAADSLRANGTIYNKTNRTLYVNWGTAAATTSNIDVPPGSNIDIPEGYTGAIQGICAAGVTGNVRTEIISYL